MRASDIINSGGLKQTIHQWEQGGGGSAGRAQAKRYLQRNYPDASNATIEAILGRARDSLQKGRDIERNREREIDRPIQQQDIPDVTGLQRGAGQRGQGRIEVTIRIDLIDRETGEIVASTTVVVYGKYGDTLRDILSKASTREIVHAKVAAQYSTPRKNPLGVQSNHIVRETILSIISKL